MAISATSLLTGSDGSDQFYGGLAHGYYQTSAVALTAGRLYVLAFESRHRYGSNDLGPDPVQTGANWDLIDWQRYATNIGGDNGAIYAWRCQPASNVSSAVIQIPTPGAYDAFTMWTHGQWHLIEIQGVIDDSANNGVGAIHQVVNNGTAGVAATSIYEPFTVGGAASMSVVGVSNGPGGVSAATGYTELAETSSDSGDTLHTSFASTSTSPAGASWVNSQNAGVIGIELKVALPPVVLPGLLHIPFKDRLFSLILTDDDLPEPDSLALITSQDFDNFNAIERWAAQFMDIIASPSKCRLFIPHKQLHDLSATASQDNWNAIERWAHSVIMGICSDGFSPSCHLFIPYKTVLGDLHAGRITLGVAQAREFVNYKTVENWANRLHRGEC